MPTPNRRHSDIVCCARCGRDTRARSGVCAQCAGRHLATDEYRGRKARPVPHLDELEDRYDDESGPDDIAGGIE